MSQSRGNWRGKGYRNRGGGRGGGPSGPPMDHRFTRNWSNNNRRRNNRAPWPNMDHRNEPLQPPPLMSPSSSNGRLNTSQTDYSDR